ncbi:flagellar biosynthetic protein FliQ [Thermodesulfobium sp. 4217-1]|jgi:flagellar biosynthetic protein FliQ|uniref:flagellar biosynthetic protein FliQ n=1 Tax=Thermodesulfobium sp. 4217-1 TaxID=3120013 RepID=UPI0032219923
MSQGLVLDLSRNAMLILLLITAPVLFVALFIGLFLGIFQAATQLQDITISFVPKLLAVIIVMFLLGPFTLNVLTDYIIRLYQNIPNIIK